MDEAKSKLNKATQRFIKNVYGKYKPINIIATLGAISIAEIISKAELEWAFPEFQREIVWKPSQVKSLLQSILLYHFIGNFVIWQGNNEKEIPFEITYIDENSRYNKTKVKGIILDGKQRTSSLYNVLKEKYYDKDKKLYFYIDFIELSKYYASKKKNFSEDNIIITRNEDELYKDDETYELFRFPLYKINEYDKWITDLKNHYNNFSEDKYFKYFVDDFIKKELEHFLSDPIVPVVNLLPNDIPPNSASIIFELINSKGVPLNAFDRLVAHLESISNYKIKLRKNWKEVKEGDLEKAYEIFGSHLPFSIVQGMYLCYSENPNAPSEKNILKMYDDQYKDKQGDFEKEWRNLVKIAKDVVEHMKTSYGVCKKDYLPANSLLPTLIAIWNKAGKEINKNKKIMEKIDEWYWSAVFSGQYKSATTNRMATDVKEMEEWFKGGKIPDVIRNTIKEWNDKNKDKVEDLKEASPNSAIHKGVLGLIISNNALDPLSSRKVIELINDDEIDRDHIFPQDMFKENNERKKRIPDELKKYKDSVLNKSFLFEGTNRSKKNICPSAYIELLISDRLEKENISKEEVENKVKKDLETQFINSEAYEAMKNDKFETFLEARGKAILKEIRKRIGAKP